MADLLRRLKEELPRLTALSDQIEAHESEDLLYRFYHHSFKVYRLQNWTAQIVAALQRVQEDQG